MLFIAYIIATSFIATLIKYAALQFGLHDFQHHIASNAAYQHWAHSRDLATLAPHTEVQRAGYGLQLYADDFDGLLKISQGFHFSVVLHLPWYTITPTTCHETGWSYTKDATGAAFKEIILFNFIFPMPPCLSANLSGGSDTASNIPM